MKLYFASSTCGLNTQDRITWIREGRPKYLLNTFFEGENVCKKVMADVQPDNFLLDSGAFSFMSGAECSEKIIEEYAERYIEFIKRNNVRYFFEMDVDTIFGIQFTEYLRRKIETAANRQSIPVWHKGRGVEYWKRMCDQYQYVAIGGLVFHVKKQELPTIRKLVDYAAGKGVKVHGLGFTRITELDQWQWYSVDSSTWTKSAALGQNRYDFDRRTCKLRQHRVTGSGKKVILSKLILHNGIEWCKYQRYLDTKGSIK